MFATVLQIKNENKDWKYEGEKNYPSILIPSGQRDKAPWNSTISLSKEI